MGHNGHLYTDFLSEGLIFAYEQAHHRILYYDPLYKSNMLYTDTCYQNYT